MYSEVDVLPAREKKKITFSTEMNETVTPEEPCEIDGQPILHGREGGKKAAPEASKRVPEICLTSTEKAAKVINPKSMPESGRKSPVARAEGDNPRWRQWMQKAEMNLDELRQTADKYEHLYHKHKDMFEERTAELVALETKYDKLERHCKAQEDLMTQLRLDQAKLAQELEVKKGKLAGNMKELRCVREKSDDLSRKFIDMERQLYNAEEARKSELENLRCVQGSFEASEKHFASVLEQVRNLMHENETAHMTNFRLNKEKREVDKELCLTVQATSTLTTELAKAHQEMKQISSSLKLMEREKEQLYRKLKEQRFHISKLEKELEEKDQLLQSAIEAKIEMENQLKLSNLCLSRALGSNNKADIFPGRRESLDAAGPLEVATTTSAVKELREENAGKDLTIMRLIDEVNKLEEELQDCKMDLLKAEEVNKVSKECCMELGVLPKDLDREIKSRDEAIDSLRLTVEKVIAQRNRLGLQCVRKKEQNELLKKKNKALQDIMLIGNHLYDEGLKRIKAMKTGNEDGTGQLSVLMQRVEDIEYMECSRAKVATNDRQYKLDLSSQTEGTSTSEPPQASPRTTTAGCSYTYEMVMNI